MVASCVNDKESNLGNQNVQDSYKTQSVVGSPMHQPISTTGVSNFYVFKSRLQEYAQKVGIITPVYETFREGPSHEPSFSSTVIVNGVRYNSLPGFSNRKAAEQSAAEIALMELSKCGEEIESMVVPVHETGLCKNLLQEYTQKMNYAIPTYISRRHDNPSGRSALFSCSVDIGGIKYIGGIAKNRKEAEIKAARTALLAIQSSSSFGVQKNSIDKGETLYAVVPCKKKVSETAPPPPPPCPQKKPVKFKRSRRHYMKKKRDKALAKNVWKLGNNDSGGHDNLSSNKNQPRGGEESVEGGQALKLNHDSSELGVSSRCEENKGLINPSGSSNETRSINNLMP